MVRSGQGGFKICTYFLKNLKKGAWLGEALNGNFPPKDIFYFLCLSLIFTSCWSWVMSPRWKKLHDASRFKSILVITKGGNKNFACIFSSTPCEDIFGKSDINHCYAADKIFKSFPDIVSCCEGCSKKYTLAFTKENN